MRRIGDAQPFALNAELIPFTSAGHRGALAVEDEIAERKGDLGDIRYPGEKECVSCLALTTKHSCRSSPPMAIYIAADGKNAANEKDASYYNEAR
jgi:hypothetical protein